MCFQTSAGPYRRNWWISFGALVSGKYRAMTGADLTLQVQNRSDGEGAAAPPSIRVLVADADTRFVTALIAVLESHGSFVIVGRARNGHEAVELADTKIPDVVLMNIELPVMDGVEATRHIRAAVPSANVIAISDTDYQERALEMRAAGAADYLRKSRFPDEFVSTILSLASRSLAAANRVLATS